MVWLRYSTAASINMIAKSAEKQTGINSLLFAYRVAVQDSTWESPIYLTYGRDAWIPTQMSLKQPRMLYQVDITDHLAELVAHLSYAWALAHEHIHKIHIHVFGQREVGLSRNDGQNVVWLQGQTYQEKECRGRRTSALDEGYSESWGWSCHSGNESLYSSLKGLKIGH